MSKKIPVPGLPGVSYSIRTVVHSCLVWAPDHLDDDRGRYQGIGLNPKKMVGRSGEYEDYTEKKYYRSFDDAKDLKYHFQGTIKADPQVSSLQGLRSRAATGTATMTATPTSVSASSFVDMPPDRKWTVYCPEAKSNSSAFITLHNDSKLKGIRVKITLTARVKLQTAPAITDAWPAAVEVSASMSGEFTKNVEASAGPAEVRERTLTLKPNHRIELPLCQVFARVQSHAVTATMSAKHFAEAEVKYRVEKAGRLSGAPWCAEFPIMPI